MALLDDIANVLEANGVGGGSDEWAIVKGALMPTPIKQIALIETGGYAPTNESVQGYDYPTFQVIARTVKYDYQEGRAKMQEIYDALHLSDLGGGYVDCMAVQSAPMFVGFDKDEQPNWSLNFRAMACR